MTLEEFNRDKAVMEFVGTMCEDQKVITAIVPKNLEKMVELLGEGSNDYILSEVSFGDLFGSLYASWKMVKDNPEQLKEWSHNTLIILQGNVTVNCGEDHADDFKESE